MNRLFKLFILEDTDNIFAEYEDLIKDIAKKQSFMIDVHRETKVNPALSFLKTAWYDGAIIDIRLSSSDEAQNGNQIIREIKENLRFPIRVYTGFDDIDDDLQEQNEFYKIYKRTDKRFNEVLTELFDIYNTGITHILGKKGLIDKYLQRVFWDHISHGFENWIAEAKANIKTEKVLLRHTLAHLNEFLDANDDGSYDNYHPAEFFIINPIDQKVHTGLILEDKTTHEQYILLSPACDLINKPDSRLLLCKITKEDPRDVTSKKELYFNRLNELSMAEQSGRLQQIEKAKRKLQDAKDDIMEISRNCNRPQFHYLPPVGLLGGFIDFQHILTTTFAELEANYNKMASITDKFCKDIVARFSQYYSRQGQPCFDPSCLCKLLHSSGIDGRCANETSA